VTGVPGDAGAALDGGLRALRTAYAQGLEPTAVVDEVLARISAADDPAIWIDVESRADLHRAARALVARGSPELPLWGVPFGVKDNIDVAHRTTTAGLPGIARRADRSATVVARLLAAGAVYVGKTNLDQLATGLVGTRSPYGTPRNPLDPQLVPGGSSSGSAVAVARRQVAFALGTDTAGSGRVPAAMCGIVGLKGAPGTRPVDGIVPASPSIDCVSTFATSVVDGLAIEGVLAATPWPVSTGSRRVATSGLDPDLEAQLAGVGHKAVSVDLAPFHEAGDLLYGGPWLADRTAALSPLLAGDPTGVDPIVRQVVARGLAYSGVEVFAAKRRLRELVDGLALWWEAVDVLVVPTITWWPTLDEVAADPIGLNLSLGRNTTFANLLGLATISVPAPSGPGGVTVCAPTSHEGHVAAVAAALAHEVVDPPGRLVSADGR
jgi:allophanate hydrolase